MRSSKLKVAASLSLLTVAMGGCTESGPDGNDPVRREYSSPLLTHIDAGKMTISDSEKQYLRSQYSEIVKLSGEQVTAKLVFVEGREEFVCGEAGGVQTVITSRNSPAYCPPDSVIMTGAWVRLWARDLSSSSDITYEPAYDYALAHEVRHDLELKKERTDSVTRELRADCFAGRIMGKMIEQGLRDVDSIGDTLAVIRELPADAGEQHGTPEERVAAYLDGVAGRDC